MLKSKQTSLCAIKRSLLRSTPEVQKLHAGILQISNYLPPSQKGSHLRKFNLNKCTNTAYNLEARTSLQKQKRYVKDNKTEKVILSTIQLHRSLPALPLYYYEWRSLVIIKTCIYKCTIKKYYANKPVKVCEHNPAIFSLAQFPKQSQSSAPPWTYIL